MRHPNWHKSTYSDNGDCVELADLGDAIGMRDSKHPDAGHVTLTRGQLGNLLATLKAQPVANGPVTVSRRSALVHIIK